MKAIKNYFKTLFLEEYQVVIWNDGADDRTIYALKKIEKIDPNNLVGVLTTGEKFEMCVQTPFNFTVKKIH